jgi:hypothetical protein
MAQLGQLIEKNVISEVSQTHIEKLSENVYGYSGRINFDLKISFLKDK